MRCFAGLSLQKSLVSFLKRQTLKSSEMLNREQRREKRRKDGFFSKERVEERHAFRVKVSANRKWIFIGLAVVAVCATIIYLSITYGGGSLGFLKGLF